MHIKVKKSNNKYYAPLARAGSRISRPLPVLARADPRVDPRVDPGVDPSMDNSNSDKVNFKVGNSKKRK